MVFSVSKRRVRVKAQDEADTTFLDLPDELLLAILERTDSITEVLRLRQTSKVFVPACSSIVRNQLKTLYIHPRKTSVDRAIQIRESRFRLRYRGDLLCQQGPLEHDPHP